MQQELDFSKFQLVITRVFIYQVFFPENKKLNLQSVPVLNPSVLSPVTYLDLISRHYHYLLDKEHLGCNQ